MRPEMPGTPQSRPDTRVIAISGGSRGIGLATARACASAGMAVAIGDLDRAGAEAAAAALGGGGLRSRPVSYTHLTLPTNREV